MVRILNSRSQKPARVRPALRYLAVIMLSSVVHLSWRCDGRASQPGSGRAELVDALTLAEPTHHLDVLAREPMVVEHPDGTLFVTGYGASIPVLWSSDDGGATWQRVDIGTEADGAVGNSDVDLAIGPDGGRTWQERPRIHTSGGSSHLAVGRDGEIAVRITPMFASGNLMDEDTDFIAVSSDAGRSWQLHEPPGTRVWTFPLDLEAGVPRWVEPLAWDAAGALYYLWSEGTALLLGRSTDDGRRWSTWPIVQGQALVYFPYLVANGTGELAATWYSGRGDEVQAHVALITIDYSNAPRPQVTGAEPFVVDSFRKTKDGALTRDTAGEYLPVIFLNDGRMAVVSTIQDSAGDRWGFTWRPILRSP